MIYFSIPFLFVTGVLLARNSRAWTVIYWFSCGLLILLAGLRWETGTDWLPYSTDFAQPGMRGDFEIGYVLLVQLISHFTTSYTVFLLLTALISTTLVFYVCYELCGPDTATKYAAVLVFYSYYFLGSWLGAERRQYAIALCFLALIWIKMRKPVLFLCTVALAALFHVSSLVFVPAYWIYHMSRKRMITFFFVTCAFALIVKVVGFEGIVASVFKSLHLGFVSIKVLAYLIGGAGEKPPTTTEILFGLAKRVAILLLFWIVWRSKRKENVDAILNLYAASVALYFFSMFTVPMFSVMTIYYSISEVLLIPITLVSFRLNRATMALALLVYGLIQVSSILRPYWVLYVPYYSILDHASRQVLY